MPVRTQIEALLHGKCPRCRQGDIFTYPVSKLQKFHRMNDYCPVCKVHFQPEPGFYQGAMYVGYAFTIAFLVAVSIVLYLLGNPSDWVYIITFIGLMIAFAPFNYRYSRIIYLYYFGGLKFDPTYKKT